MWPFKRKEKGVRKALNHKHDWFFLEISKEYFYDPTENEWWKLPKGKPGSYFVPAINRVCLTCGLCQDQIGFAKRQIKEQEKQRQKRKELAEKIWAHCKDTETK